mmetsp:Transcript_11382/g.36021  ORF Transcript_11382/g.36021 Transcript_11382/m.36021 type:complete len:211 (+) Transcript_11382:335-967(+)
MTHVLGRPTMKMKPYSLCDETEEEIRGVSFAVAVAVSGESSDGAAAGGDAGEPHREDVHHLGHVQRGANEGRHPRRDGRRLGEQRVEHAYHEEEGAVVREHEHLEGGEAHEVEREQLAAGRVDRVARRLAPEERPAEGAHRGRLPGSQLLRERLEGGALVRSSARLVRKGGGVLDGGRLRVRLRARHASELPVEPCAVRASVDGVDGEHH